MRLYETRLGRVVDFEPASDVARIYTCGITPYDATHVGHAFTFLAYDVLQRRLRDLGYETRCVRNITDVDDDILDRAAQLDVHYLDLAAGAVATFQADMAALGLLPAFSEPRATSAISDVRAFIGRVLDSGHAYEADGSVFFDVSTAPTFGQLGGLDPTAMAEANARVERPLAGRRSAVDFALWQPSRQGEPTWESMWGPGRPGWHVECAVMALRELGAPIDIHGGGADLVYPHHECEQAQAEAAIAGTFVRHWMHTATVHVDGAKMAKSAGNMEFVADLRRVHSPMAVRLAIVTNHYRHEWEWHEGLVIEAAARLARWAEAGSGTAALQEVRAALDDDLDTPGAVRAIDQAAWAGHGVDQAAALLGIDLARPPERGRGS